LDDLIYDIEVENYKRALKTKGFKNIDLLFPKLMIQKNFHEVLSVIFKNNEVNQTKEIE